MTFLNKGIPHIRRPEIKYFISRQHNFIDITREREMTPHPNRRVHHAYLFIRYSGEPVDFSIVAQAVPLFRTSRDATPEIILESSPALNIRA